MSPASIGGVHFYNSVGVQSPTELQALRACCLIKAGFEKVERKNYEIS
jgi:hypothetical protein